MRIRKRLVSNSSTSSFILFGFVAEDMKAEEIMQKLLPPKGEMEPIDRYDYVWDAIYNGFRVPDIERDISGFHGEDIGRDGIVIGIQPVYLREHESAELKIDFAEIGRQLDILAERLGLDPSTKRLFVGTRAC